MSSVSYRKASRRLKRCLKRFNETGNEYYFQRAKHYQEIALLHKAGVFSKILETVK